MTAPPPIQLPAFRAGGGCRLSITLIYYPVTGYLT